MATFGEIVKFVRKSQNLSQERLAAKASMSAYGLGKIESGKTKQPNGATAIALVRALGYDSIDELRAAVRSNADGKNDSAVSGAVAAVRLVPILAEVPAGWDQDSHILEAYGVEEPQYGWAYPDTDISDPKLFALRVRGTSMLPVLPEGARVICSPADVHNHGFLDGLWYAIRYQTDQGDERTTIKIVERIDDHQLRLVPRNEQHPTHVIRDDQVLTAARVVEVTYSAPSLSEPGALGAEQDVDAVERELRDGALERSGTPGPNGSGAA